MRVFACNVVSKLQRNRCISFGGWRSRTNWPLHFYIYRLRLYIRLWLLFHADFLLGFHFCLENRETCFSETSVDFQRTTQKLELFIATGIVTTDPTNSIRVYLTLIKRQNTIFHAIKVYEEGRSVMFGTWHLSFVLRYKLKLLNWITSDIPKFFGAASDKNHGSIFW
jgi:hypothetical protein